MDCNQNVILLGIIWVTYCGPSDVFDVTVPNQFTQNNLLYPKKNTQPESNFILLIVLQLFVFSECNKISTLASGTIKSWHIKDIFSLC